MRKLLFVIFFVMYVHFDSYTQDILVRTYGGELNEKSYDFIETPDKGFFLLGSTGSNENENSDIYLVKIDSLLNFEWSKTYGTNQVDYGVAIINTDDDYLILGNSNENSDYGIVLYKIDLDGNEIWNQNYGGNNWDFGHSLIKNTAGGFLIGGETYSQGNGANDAYIIAINNDGDIMWEKTYGGVESDVCNSITQDDAGNTFFCGTTSVLDTNKVFLVQIDPSSNGDIVWEMNYGDVESYGNYLSTENSAIIVVGKKVDGVSKQLIAKFDSLGNLIWEKTSGNDANQELNSFTINSLNQIISIGTGDTYGAGGNDVLVYRRNSDSGNFIDAITYGGEFDDRGVKIIHSSNGELIVLADLDKYVNQNLDFGIIKFPTDTAIAGIPFDIESFVDTSLPVEEVSSIEQHYFSINSIDENHISIDFQSVLLGGEFFLIDTNGKILLSQKIVNKNLEIPTNNYAFGFYNLVCRKDNFNASVRILIQ